MPTISRKIIACIMLVTLAACQPMGNQADIATLSDPERQLFEQAASKRAAGNIDEALALYTQAAKLSTGAVEAHVAIAEMLRKENRSAQAMPMLKDALAMKPRDARLYMEKGFALIAMGQYADAEQAFNDALGLDSDLGSAYSGKAVAIDLQGRHSDAQRLYAEAKARGLGSPSLDNNFALSLIFSGKYDEAIRLLTPHANASTATATMRQNLALAYGLKGDVGRAEEYGKKDLDPITARRNLAFYKRYASMRQQEIGTLMTSPQATATAAGTAHQAVPVMAVDEGNVGFVTGGKGGEVVLQPKVDVIEVDAEAFEQMAQ